MQAFLVGGAVRDALLGLPVQDRDFVVVGATPEAMLAQGYTPVGKDFPVFLHPQTHEEYALARTERKTAPGYRGFVFHAAPDITLEQDLARRDLSINAMAQAEDGSLVDPFGGRADLQARILRHVSAAFAEDPVRILRVARFAARFTDFRIAPETADLMRSMVQAGEVDALVPERVWQEFSRGLMEARPSRMIAVLQECGALARLLPMLAVLWPEPGVGRDHHAASVSLGDATLALVDSAALAQAALPVRLALLLQATVPRDGTETRPDPTPVEQACQRLKTPLDCRDLALATARERDVILAAPMPPMPSMPPTAVLEVLERCDAIRKPARFEQLLEALGFLQCTAQSLQVLVRWRAALAAARAVDAGAVAAAVRQDFPGQPMRINQAVRQARIEAIGRVDPAEQDGTAKN